jgi:SRSO17 transposase
MAARLVEDEARVEAMRQRLRQSVARSDWSDSEVRRRLARKLDEELPEVEAYLTSGSACAAPRIKPRWNSRTRLSMESSS